MKYLISILIFFFSSTVFAQEIWVKTQSNPEGGVITDIEFTELGTILVTSGSYNWPSVPGGIRRSTDKGNSWANVLNGYNARTLAIGSNGAIYASFWNYPANEGLYVSYNDGQTWMNRYYLATTGNNIFSILPVNNNMTIFLGTRNGVLRSTDGGQSFPAANSGIPPNSWVKNLAISSNGEIAAATTNGVFISTNNGSSWLPVTGLVPGDTASTVRFFSIETETPRERLLIGTQQGRVHEAWEENQFLNALTLYIFTEETYVSNIIRSTAERYLVSHFGNGNTRGGVSRSTNSGINFTAINEGLPPNPRVSGVEMHNFETYQIICAILFSEMPSEFEVYLRTIPIGIQQISAEVPSGFSLSQNYPNPFNPVTKLKFQVPRSENVKIAVYDALGKEIEVLMNGQLKSGTYEADWNAINFSSGIYYYRMTAGDFSATKKMILVK